VVEGVGGQLATASVKPTIDLSQQENTVIAGDRSAAKINLDLTAFTDDFFTHMVLTTLTVNVVNIGFIKKQHLIPCQ